MGIRLAGLDGTVSVAAVNSGLQRARTTLDTRPAPRPKASNGSGSDLDKKRMRASNQGSYAVQRGRRDVVVAVLVAFTLFAAIITG